MNKTPFITKEQAQEISKTYPTPFHLYDEKGIRENAKAVKEAFAWNPGFKEYFAVKATPNPYLIDILREYGCGCDCSSLTELMLSEAMGVSGSDIMFSSNDTPAEEYAYAAKLGAIINLDDITHIDFVEKILGKLPETMSCRYNPGGVFKMSNGIMDNPGDAKYGMTPEQILEELLGDLGLEINETLPTRFFCNCSKERVSKALVSGGAKELQSMIDDGKEIEVNCHFCNTNYSFSVEELKELLKKSR